MNTAMAWGGQASPSARDKPQDTPSAGQIQALRSGVSLEYFGGMAEVLFATRATAPEFVRVHLIEIWNMCMNAKAAIGVLGMLTILIPIQLAAQPSAGEFGLIGGWGRQAPYRAGAGVFGGTTIRAVYAGGRFVKHFGSSSFQRIGTGSMTVDRRTWFVAAEIGLPVVRDPFEFRFSVNIGASRFNEDTITQLVGGGIVTETFERTTKPMFAPSIGWYVQLPSLKIGAEVAYLVGGDPNFTVSFGQNSLALYTRVIVPTGPS